MELGEELEPGNPRSRTSWETGEYLRSNGLGMINASGGYAIRSTGRAGGTGMTIAVLDDGVDLSHPDLLPGEHDAQYAFAGAQLPRDHGTSVAGVALARRNGFGMHGVAYNANLVSIGTCKSSGGCFGDNTQVLPVDETAADIASASGLERTYGANDSNPEAISDVINMSFAWVGTHYIDEISTSMVDAAGAGRIMVAALGNDGGIGPAGTPASNVADPGIAGHAIAVGALDSSGTGQASFSNTCHGVSNYCLFAPGDDVYSTTVGGGYAYVDGTSFAAPIVSGAAAAVWAAFPNKSGAQIVQRLLTTADDMGNSSTFGHGRLDLAAAMNPVGFLSVPVNGGSMVPLSDTSVSLPPGFGAPSGTSSLAGNVVYDEQMFPFLVDLNRSFHTARPTDSGNALGEFLSSLGTSSSVSLAPKATVEFVHDDEPADLRRNLAHRADDEQELESYRFSFNPLPQLEVTVGQGFSSIGSSNEFVAARTGRTVLGSAGSVGPFTAFAGRGLGMTLDWRWDDTTSLDFSGKLGEGYFGSSDTRLASLGLTRRVNDDVTVGARYGLLQESDSRMGIRTAEAFANVPDAETGFLDLSVEGRVTDTVSMFGSVSHGTSSGGTPGASSLVTRWGELNASSFVIGAELHQILRDRDRLTVTASSPFRAREASVDIDVPVREVADGEVEYARETVDLEPSGHERRMQLVYETGPGFVTDRASLAVGGYLRIDPDHDADADTDLGAAARLRVDF